MLTLVTILLGFSTIICSNLKEFMQVIVRPFMRFT
jgi:hypothetical protein